ncbi:C13 family peptidase [Pseudomonas denitrificans (nom. rej.)]|uniref:Peptidase C13 n=1 Tax=Pseudomonas denitrificans TaxID=43306 RepID=A0A9X7N5I3_PSEDE|nr:C13 family peptidase [Pseudomonas denitrificans (nom. rej.)]QEY75408.1 peptidase C13 [Pseudomonas denitrificans (nom. rej.)]
MPRQLLPLSLALLLTACGEGEPLTPPDARLPDGARYRGELVNGQLQGPGRLDYSNGAWYEGGFDKGLQSGQGKWNDGNGTSYEGEFRDGLFEGRGRLQYADGSFYEGQFKRGEFDGEGRISQGGTTYSGGFRKGRYEGLGSLEQADGTHHQGAFSRGEANGEGARRDSLGNQYSGPFKNGVLEGKGIFRDDAGDQYAGEFRNDQFDGTGRFQNADGDVWFGRFKAGALSGPGEFIGADGSRYKGDFRFWRFDGQGTLTRADGQTYSGGFARGEYSGAGTLTRHDGSVQKGTWSAGQLRQDAAGKTLPNPLEVGLLEQGAMLEKALAAVPQSTPAIELYGVSLGGDGKQSVFLREADYVANLLGDRFGARGVVRLVNHRDHLADRPMATRETLARTLRTIAQRSGPEDLVFIYLTSHGSHDHQLVLDMPGLKLDDLPASELANLLAPLKDRTKVLVISACYSGGFIPALKDDKTLIMTAARSDRVSFGCSEEADFTYFGDALFAKAFQQTDDLRQAFKLASATVAKREKEEEFEPSEPQLWAPDAVITRWQALRAQQTHGALALGSNDAQAKGQGEN